MSDKNFKVKNGIDAVGPITISPSSNSITSLIINSVSGGTGIIFNRNGSSVASIDDWGTYNGSGINIVQNWTVRSPGIEAQSFFWVGSGARSSAGFSGTNSGTNPVIYISQNGTATNDLTQWIKADNTVLAKVDYLGNLTANDLTLAGNLTVNGTTTNLNSTNLIIEDKNIIIADVATPTNTTADGAGITIKGATDKTFNWVQSTGRFTSSEPIQSSAFISTEVYASQIGSTVIGTATLNTNSDTGGILVNTAGAANKGLIIRGANSQTANLQQWQTSNGTTLMQVGGGGDLFMSSATRAFFGGSDTAGYVNISTAGNGARQGLVIKSAPSQTANLQEWQDSAGTVLTTIDSSGRFVIGRGTQLASAILTIQGNTSTYSPDNTSALANRIIFLRGNTGGNLMALSSKGDTAQGVAALVITNGGFSTEITGFGYNGNIYTNIQAATTVGLTVKGAASQTANLTEWQNSDGTVLSRIDANGIISLPGGSWHLLNAQQTWYKNSVSFYQKGPSHTFRRQSDDLDLLTIGGNGNTEILLKAAGAVGLIVKGFASQTANLQQWQDSAGNLVAWTGFDGRTYLSYSMIGTWNLDAQQTIYSNSASRIGQVIRGAASQTANLQQWQNSAGGVLAYVSNDGTFQNTGDINSGSTIRLGSGASSAGGYPVFAIKNATVAPTSNPTDGGVIYVESGSLKYRGQGGAITTIASSSLDDQEDIENSEVQLIQYGAEGSVLQNLPTRIHPAEQLLKESVLWLDPAHSSAGSQTIQNLGWGGTALNATAGENTSVSTDEPKYLSWEGENYIYATGEAGNFMISSASTSLGMTTSSDLDMRVKVSLDALSGINQMFISTWWYRLYLTSSGYVSLSWHDNTTFNNINSSNLLSSVATVGQEIWIRGTLKLNNGSGVSEVKFYTSINGTTWTQLGTTYNGASTSILGAGGRSLSLEVGSLDGGVASVVSGKIYRAQVLQGVDGVVVFDCDTSLVSSGSATTFNALTGHIMTITRNTVGRKMVAVTHPLWLFGTNDFLKIAHNNLLDFATNQPFTIFLSSREFASTAGTTILLSKGGYGVWQGYTITSQNNFTQAYFSGPQANTSYYYSANLGKSTTSRSYFYGRSTTNTFSYVNNNLIGGSEEVAPQYDTSNNYDFYLGRQTTGQNSNMEVFGVAIWRRALTSAEIATVSRYYEGRAI